MTDGHARRRFRTRASALVVVLATAASGLVAGVAATVATASPAVAGPSASVRNFGNAPALGAPPMVLNAPLIGLAAHPKQAGYWLLSRDGGVFTYGRARFHGSTGAMRLKAPVVGIASTKSGNGYWLVASDGGVFSFGDAKFRGSTGAKRLNQPIVGMAVTPSGTGYWLVARDGGVFSFGDARFRGSLGSVRLDTQIVGIAAAPTGLGYVLAGGNGAAWSFGSAYHFSSARSRLLSKPVVDVELTKSGKGLWMLTADGGVLSHGTATYRGGANPLPGDAVGIARNPSGLGYWIATRPSLFPPVPAFSGAGRRIVYSNSGQRVWLIEADGFVSHSWLVSGRPGAPPPGTYAIRSKSPMSSAGSLRLPWMSRFYLASSGKWIGFHGIPLRPDGTPIQTDAELGQYRSHGCVRMNQLAVKVLYDWAPIGTPVIVLA